MDDLLPFSFDKSLAESPLQEAVREVLVEEWSSGIDLKVAGTEKKEEEFLDGFLDGKRQAIWVPWFPIWTCVG